MVALVEGCSHAPEPCRWRTRTRRLLTRPDQGGEQFERESLEREHEHARPGRRPPGVWRPTSSTSAPTRSRASPAIRSPEAYVTSSAPRRSSAIAGGTCACIGSGRTVRHGFRGNGTGTCVCTCRTTDHGSGRVHGRLRSLARGDAQPQPMKQNVRCVPWRSSACRIAATPGRSLPATAHRARSTGG